MDIVKEKIAICYHANCADGAGSVYVVQKFLWRNSFLKRLMDFYPLNYGAKGIVDLPENIENYKEILFLDFCLKNEDQINNLKNKGIKLTLVDHHEVEDKLHLYDQVTFDKKKSGAILTWNHFFGDHPPDIILQYVQDNDIWNHSLPYTKEINAYIQLLDKTVENNKTFKEWCDVNYKLTQYAIDETNPIVLAGKLLIKQNENYINYALKTSREVTFAGEKVACVNSNNHCISNILNRLCTNHPSHTAISWYQESDGKFKYSIRTIGDTNAANLASQFGGGGHKNAAGFYSTSLVHQDID